MRIGQPEVMDAGAEHPLARELELLPEAQILDVAPADLVRQAQFVMRTREDRIERILVAALHIVAARAVVVLHKHARPEANFLEAVSHDPVAHPGANLVYRQRAKLIGHLRPVIEIARQRAYPTEAGGPLVQVAGFQVLHGEARPQVPELIDIQAGVRYYVVRRGVDAVKVVALQVMVENALAHDHHGRCESVDPEAAQLICGTYAVEAARNVGPPGIADEPVVAVAHLETSGLQTEAIAFLGAK